MLWCHLQVGDVVVSEDTAFLVIELDEGLYKWLDLNSGDVSNTRPDLTSRVPAGWETIMRDRAE